MKFDETMRYPSGRQTAVNFITPLIPTLVDTPPEGGEWLTEVKSMAGAARS